MLINFVREYFDDDYPDNPDWWKNPDWWHNFNATPHKPGVSNNHMRPLEVGHTKLHATPKKYQLRLVIRQAIAEVEFPTIVQDPADIQYVPSEKEMTRTIEIAREIIAGNITRGDSSGPSSF